MKKRFSLPPLAVFLCLSGSLNAAVIPKHSPFDTRVQYVEYNPDNVVKVRAKVGRTVTVELDKNENAEQGMVAMGDAQAWNIAVKGNYLIFKPTAASPQTNLTVITDKRTYLFDLSLSGSLKTKKGKRVVQQPTYLLRFTYPDEEAKAKQQRLAAQERALALSLKYGNQNDAVLNYRYFGRGDKAIAPTAIWDDNRFTFIQYADNRDLPAVYKINPDGSEMLVNTHIEDDTLIIHETAKAFVLRLGESVLGVRNAGYQTGEFNRLKTNQPDSVRINKGME